MASLLLRKERTDHKEKLKEKRHRQTSGENCRLKASVSSHLLVLHMQKLRLVEVKQIGHIFTERITYPI